MPIIHRSITRRITLIALLFTLALLLFPSYTVAASQQSPREFIEAFTIKLIAGKVDDCYQLLDPQKQASEAKQGLEALSRMIGNQKIDGNRVVFTQTRLMRSLNEETRHHTIHLEYTINGNYYLLETNVREEKDRLTMNRYYMTPIPYRVEHLNSFSLRNKGPHQYLFLVLMIAIPLFIVISLVTMFRSDIKKKWLWFFIIICAAIKFTLNWETGQLDFQIFSVQLFGAGFIKSPAYAPWHLHLALPLGAVAYWLQLRRAARTPETARQSDAHNDTPRTPSSAGPSLGDTGENTTL